MEHMCTVPFQIIQITKREIIYEINEAMPPKAWIQPYKDCKIDSLITKLGRSTPSKT